MTVCMGSGFLATFILSELRPILARHPRFRDNDGSSLIAFSNLISYKDVSLVVGAISSDGASFSPDSFVCTLLGRVCAAKLEGYNGTFIEWTRETTTEDLQPPAGVYYLSIDAINEETKDVRVVVQPYRWSEGTKTNAQGSRIYIHPSIPIDLVTSTDPTIELSARSSYILLLTYTDSLVLQRTDTGQVLTPGTDYWLELAETHLLLVTLGGAESKIKIPDDCLDFRLLEDGCELRQGCDWDWDGEGTIRLAPWTLAGTHIYIDGRFRRTPQGSNVVHQENFLDTPALGLTEEHVQGQCLYTINRGTYIDDLLWSPNGVCFKHLMTVGDRATWELRIKQAQVYSTVKKMACNPEFLPGLTIAVGDMVELGDQMALVVFPKRCEIYEVYGGKEGVQFDLAIKSNDLLTSSELASLVKNYLLIDGRDRLESAGLTITRISSNYQGEQRDSSGTASSHTVTLAISGSGDWERWKPLINSVSDIEIAVAQQPWGTPQLLDVTVAYGISRFTPSYQ